MNTLTTQELPEYTTFLKQATTEIHKSYIRTVRSVNKEVTSLYWWLGEHIVQYQDQYGWGKSVVERLSKDLKQKFPSAKFGFSPQNLWYMRQFYLEYNGKPELQQLVGEIPWGQNLLIMSKVKEDNKKLYYLQSTKDFAWTRDTLRDQINSNAYERHYLATKHHNFDSTLPKMLAEQADQSMKDVYMFDMLGIAEPVIETEIERRMVEKIKDVIMELGYGFSFIGNQYRIVTPDSEYFIDLLFYHRKLQALVALELKRTRFKPEHAGKMNFYLNLLDEFVKEPNENPSIGIILCGEHSKFDVEYALRGIDKPVGVAGYQLTRDIPEKLRDALPDATQLEEKIQFELGLNQDKSDDKQ
ncbi:PDDEXK nuclease domain-containing protein [Fastidiosibacter lacustris]|uniref:PDDEXK nuclease domain-containing protein n=1 Tax=Fastidiosibacter lacustris TaxID=2056695 RepID=UPI000E353A03|nr:PDDEXK nuclease domain-containing protein [Fastidiosibacter lacustris]